MFKEVMEKIEQLYLDGVVPGVSYAIITDGKVTEKTIGYSQLYPTKEKLIPGMLYDMASLTKVVGTTTIILKLIQMKKISLDDAITKYIPDFSDERVTIRHLLTHTSAISGYIENRNQLSAGELLEKLHQLKVQDWFGKKVVYTDTGLIFLGEIIENIYNDSVQNVIKKEVLDPLGLKNSTFSPNPKEAVPTELQEDGMPLRGIVHDPKAQILKEHCGSAGLFMNLGDLVRFSELMLGNISEEKVILQNTIKSLNKDFTPEAGLKRSLGWDLKTSKNKHLCIYHTGFTGTFILIDRFCGNAMVVLTNRIHPTSDNKEFLERRDEIVRLFLEHN